MFGKKTRNENDNFIIRMGQSKGNLKPPPVKADGGKGKAKQHHTAAAVRKTSGRLHPGEIGTLKKGLR